MTTIPCKDYLDNLVKTVIDRGFNTDDRARWLILAPTSHTRSHDVPYRYTALSSRQVEEQRGKMGHEDLHIQFN
jgi:hypothetical protein